MRCPFNRARALRVKVGDEVRIDTTWNRTEHSDNKILNPVRVEATRCTSRSLTGVLFTVKTVSGRHLELDAGWFRA